MAEKPVDEPQVQSQGIGYRFTLTDACVAESIRRSQRSSQGHAWFFALKVLCGLGMVVLMSAILIMATQQEAALRLYALALVPASFLVLLIQGAKIDRWLQRRRMRRSPYFGDPVVWILSDEGAVVSTPRSESRLKWSSFTHFKRFSDGILLYSGTENPIWLADADQFLGTRDEAHQLLARHLSPGKS